MITKHSHLTALLLIALAVAMIAALTARPARAEPTPDTSADDGADADDRWATQLGDGDATATASTSARSPAARGEPPSVRAVVAAAYAAAGLARDPGHSWIRRARLSGLVPWLTVRTTRDTSWQDDESEVGHGTTLELRATWRLDRLLFDSRELQVASVEAGRHRERRRLATRVVRTYFAWRRAGAVELGGGDERSATRLAETAAELDALTDGWFSDELAGRHRRRRPEG